MNRSIVTLAGLTLLAFVAMAKVALAQNQFLNIPGSACQPRYQSEARHLEYGPQGVSNIHDQNSAFIVCPIFPLPYTGVDTLNATVWWEIERGTSSRRIFCTLYATDHRGEILDFERANQLDGPPFPEAVGFEVGGAGIQKFGGASVRCELPAGTRLASIWTAYQE